MGSRCTRLEESRTCTCSKTQFGVLPVELLDPEEDPLSGSAEGAKGFLKGNLLADPLNLPDDLLLDPMKQISVGGISNALRL